MNTDLKTEKRKWPATLGRSVADGLMDLLRPHCEPDRIVAAGSLRRGKPLVGDVEILYVPKMGEIQKPGEMFPSHGSLADNYINGLLGSKLEKRPNVNGDATWGNLNKLALHKATGLPVDLFATTALNWWVSLVIRTGPKEFNIALIRSGKSRGVQVHAYGALTDLVDGAEIFPSSEREVLELCGMKWMEPEKRI